MCWRAARSETIWTSVPSPDGGSSRVALPRSLASASRASPWRLAVATCSGSAPCPISSRSRPAGPASSATGRISQAISPTSRAGSDGCSRSSTQTGRAASSARQVCGGNSSGKRGLVTTRTTRGSGGLKSGAPPSLRLPAGHGLARSGAGGAARSGAALDDLAAVGVPAAEARVDRDVGVAELVTEPGLDGGVAALLDGGVELAAQVVGERWLAQPDDLDQVEAELGAHRGGDGRGAGPGGLSLAGSLVRQGEHGALEIGVGLALGHEAQVAAAVLGLRVDRVLLGDRRPVAAGDQRLPGLRGGRLVLGQDVADVHLDVVGLTGAQALEQLRVGRERHQPDAELVERDLGAELLAQQVVGEAVLPQQVLVAHALGLGLVPDLLDAGVDLGLVDADARLPGALQDQLDLDQALERLPRQPVDVGRLLLLALLLLVLLLRELRLDHLAQPAHRHRDPVDRGGLAAGVAGAAGDEQQESGAQDSKQTSH